MTFVAIDFEASCLPRHGRSYPVEVGIADGHMVRSWLIRTHGCWTGWDWTDEAEAIHGIPRERLLAEGLAPDRVMTELMQAVGGRPLVADSPIDQYWFEALAAAAQCETPTRILHAGILLDDYGASADRIAAARLRADRLQPRRHRAAEDAEWLYLVLADLSAQVHPYSAAA